MIKVNIRQFVYDRVWFGWGYGPMYYYDKKKIDVSWITKWLGRD